MSDPAPAAVSERDEWACLEAMRRGEPGCLAEFFELWADRLYGLALRLIGEPAAAEDVVQEAFLRLMAGAGRIEGRSRLATWLYRVAYNAAIDRLRQQRRFLPVAEDGDDEAVPAPSLLVDFRYAPDTALHDSELRGALEGAIAGLSVPLKAAFLLRDVEGLSTADAAEALGISEANLKVRLHRARLQLRERLSAYAVQHGNAGGKP